MNTNSGTRKCGFWRGHNWGKWEVLNRYNIFSGTWGGEDRRNIGTGITQQRACIDCGFVQIIEQTDKI